MAGFVPAIQLRKMKVVPDGSAAPRARGAVQGWMAGTSPAMTMEAGPRLGTYLQLAPPKRRHGNRRTIRTPSVLTSQA